MDGKEILRNNYPSNSKTQSERSELLEKRVQRIISRKVKRQKRSLSKRILGFIFEDTTKNVGEYIIHDVLIPAAKNMVCDIIGWGGFAEILLFGEKRGSRTRREGERSYTPYGSYYRQLDRERDRGISKVGRARHDFDEIIFETRGEAEEVLSHLVDLTIDYDVASVADLYDLVGIESAHTDQKYGWTDLRGASVSRVREGYMINLPRTKPID
jgi:hypothetical protein